LGEAGFSLAKPVPTGLSGNNRGNTLNSCAGAGCNGIKVITHLPDGGNQVITFTLSLPQPKFFSPGSFNPALK
jgi:hypothetical protein